MNYDEARRLKDGGWHWTSMNDGQVRTAAPCLRYEGPPLSMFGSSVKGTDFKRCEPHATQEEAERHFYDWCLEQVEEIKIADQMLRCRAEGCEGWSDTLLGNRALGRMFNGDPLCPEHRTREVLSQLHPFSPGIRMMHS